MATAVAPLPAADLKKLLEKKTTFERGLDELREQQRSLSAEDTQALLRRCMALLKSRYSSVAYWAKGRQLFRAAAAAQADGPFREELDGYVTACDEFLGDGPSSSAAQPPAAAPSAPYLFEGQLGSGAAPVQPPSLLSLIAAQVEAYARRAQGDGAGGEEAAEEAAEGAAEGAAEPLALDPEALQRELDAIAVEIMEATGQDGGGAAAAPPASRSAVAALPREALTAARLAELGGPAHEPVQCAVCLEEFAAGEEAQVMPCRHIYHPPCLAPWLSQHNSCPTCRLELPTDDQRYERGKQRRVEEAEERLGVANAVSHSDFLYI